jgi:hypothetical protein
MELHFDSTKDDSGITYSSLPQAELDALFNIIEALAYNVVADDAAYETLFTGSGATFGIYTPASLTRSATQNQLDFFIDGAAAAVSADVRGWVAFECTLGGTTETFKVWFGRDEFKLDYPHVLFTHVMYPDDPQRLLDGAYTSGILGMAQSSAFSSNEVHETVEGTDNSGTRQFTSEYNPGGIRNVLNPDVTFVAFFKGKEPTTQQTREFIRNDLLSKGLAPEEVWKPILPDLFTNGRYFLVPFWDNITQLPASVELKRGIISHKRAHDLISTIFSVYDPAFVLENLEVTMSSASEMYLIGLPSNENDPAFLSLREEHPTYQPIDGTIPHFEHQTLETQDFNVTLAAAIAALTGASNNLVFGEDEFEGRRWLTFSANFKEYHILKSDQFPLNY